MCSFTCKLYYAKYPIDSQMKFTVITYCAVGQRHKKIHMLGFCCSLFSFIGILYSLYSFITGLWSLSISFKFYGQVYSLNC